jgi:LytS/YehU family sensor histidine kinase
VKFNDLLYPFLLSLAYAFPGAAGWQYSGDDRCGPGFLRGLVQSIIWCGFLILFCLSGIVWLAKYFDGTHLHLMRWYTANELPMMLLVTWFISRWEEHQASYQELSTRAQEAQWNLLRSQLSPHFLFNALSAFAELGRRDWPATEKGLLSLSSVYRRLLDLSEGAQASLGQERLLIEDLLGIESLRLGDRLRVRWEWDEALNVVMTPPLLLLPLVENAIKHGVKGLVTGGEIVISSSRDEDGIHLEVSNTGSWSPIPSQSGGVGLKNLRARLQLGYRGKARFSIDREGDWTRAKITIPDGPFSG